MLLNSDYQAADIALDLEKRLDIDMNLEDMFSDELSAYFDYDFSKENNTIAFYFEADEGSCEIIVHMPFDKEHTFYQYNEVLSNIFYNRNYIKYEEE
jgi:hypothetical protein